MALDLKGEDLNEWFGKYSSPGFFCDAAHNTIAGSFTIYGMKK
jgi:hypothetical protein